MAQFTYGIALPMAPFLGVVAAEPAGEMRINPVPQEVPWRVPLDDDYDHARYVGPGTAGQH